MGEVLRPDVSVWTRNCDLSKKEAQAVLDGAREASREGCDHTAHFWQRAWERGMTPQEVEALTFGGWLYAPDFRKVPRGRYEGEVKLTLRLRSGERLIQGEFVSDGLFLSGLTIYEVEERRLAA